MYGTIQILYDRRKLVSLTGRVTLLYCIVPSAVGALLCFASLWTSDVETPDHVNHSALWIQNCSR